MYKIRARAADFGIRTMEGMLLENRVRTVPQLLNVNKCNGAKWEICLRRFGEYNIFALKARGGNGFSQDERYIAVGERARQELSSRLILGIPFEPGEVVTPVPNSPFLFVYSPLLFDKRDAVSVILNGGAALNFTGKMLKDDSAMP